MKKKISKKSCQIKEAVDLTALEIKLNAGTYDAALKEAARKIVPYLGRDLNKTAFKELKAQFDKQFQLDGSEGQVLTLNVDNIHKMNSMGMIDENKLRLAIRNLIKEETDEISNDTAAANKFYDIIQRRGFLRTILSKPQLDSDKYTNILNRLNILLGELSDQFRKDIKKEL